MTKKSLKKHIYCFYCYFHSGQCLCESLKSVDSRVRFTIIMHHREYHLTSNTGRLSRNTLKNCKIVLRGIENRPINWDKIIDPSEDTYILYPTQDSIEATKENLNPCPSKRVHVIVPDGSWRQASKVYKREKALSGIPCIRLPNRKYKSNYFLRKSPQENYLCTYEAMSKVIEEIESPALARLMDDNLRLLVNVSFKNRKHCLPAYSKDVK